MISVSGASGDFSPGATVRISLFDLNIFLTLPIFPSFLVRPFSPNNFTKYIKRPKYLWILEAKAPLISVLSGYFHKTPRGEGSLSPLTRPSPCCAVMLHIVPLYIFIFTNFVKLCQFSESSARSKQIIQRKIGAN